MSTVETKPRTRYDVIEELRRQEIKSEKIEILIDYLEDLWETIDFLRKKFGNERAEEIITAVSACDYTLDDYPNT